MHTAPPQSELASVLAVATAVTVVAEVAVVDLVVVVQWWQLIY